MKEINYKKIFNLSLEISIVVVYYYLSVFFNMFFWVSGNGENFDPNFGFEYIIFSLLLLLLIFTIKNKIFKFMLKLIPLFLLFFTFMIWTFYQDWFVVSGVNEKIYEPGYSAIIQISILGGIFIGSLFIKKYSKR